MKHFFDMMITVIVGFVTGVFHGKGNALQFIKGLAKNSVKEKPSEYFGQTRIEMCRRKRSNRIRDAFYKNGLPYIRHSLCRGSPLRCYFVKFTVMEQISLLVPTLIFGPQIPAPEVTMLCMLPIFLQPQEFSQNRWIMRFPGKI